MGHDAPHHAGDRVSVSQNTLLRSELLALKLYLVFLAPSLQFSFALLLRFLFGVCDVGPPRPQLNLSSKFRD